MFGPESDQERVGPAVVLLPLQLERGSREALDGQQPGRVLVLPDQPEAAFPHGRDGTQVRHAHHLKHRAGLAVAVAEAERTCAAVARPCTDLLQRGLPHSHASTFPGHPAFHGIETAATGREVAKIKLGDINARIAPLSISADGLALLGFKPINATGAAKLYDQAQFAAMCRAMIDGLQDAANSYPLAA